MEPREDELSDEPVEEREGRDDDPDAEDPGPGPWAKATGGDTEL